MWWWAISPFMIFAVFDSSPLTVKRLSFISARSNIYACCTNATNMTSVCSSVCNVGGLWSHSATKKWKSANDRIDRWLGGLHAKADPDYSILLSRIVLTKTSGVWEKFGVLDFGINDLWVKQLACLATSASAELLVFILECVILNGGHMFRFRVEVFSKAIFTCKIK